MYSSDISIVVLICIACRAVYVYPVSATKLSSQHILCIISMRSLFWRTWVDLDVREDALWDYCCVQVDETTIANIVIVISINQLTNLIYPTPTDRVGGVSNVNTNYTISPNTMRVADYNTVCCALFSTGSLPVSFFRMRFFKFYAINLHIWLALNLKLVDVGNHVAWLYLYTI